MGILTSVELTRKDKKLFQLPESENDRIEKILKKAVDKESGKLDENDDSLTEDNPDGLDISIYKDEDQLKELERKKKQNERKKSAPPKKPKATPAKTPKATPSKTPKSKTPAKKTASVAKKKPVKKAPAPKKAEEPKATPTTKNNKKSAKSAVAKKTTNSSTGKNSKKATSAEVPKTEPEPPKNNKRGRGKATATPTTEQSTKSERSSAPKRKAAIIAEVANNSLEFEDEDDMIPEPKKAKITKPSKTPEKSEKSAPMVESKKRGRRK